MCYTPYPYPYDPWNPNPIVIHREPVITTTFTTTNIDPKDTQIAELKDEVKFLRSIIEKLLSKQSLI